MAHIVDLPNGQQAEFPDEMGMEQISSIIQKQFPPNTGSMPSQQQPEMVDTFLGRMPRPDMKKQFDPKMMNEMINSAIMSMPMAGGGLLGPLKNLTTNPLVQNALRFLNRPVSGAAVGAASNPDNPLAGGVLGSAVGSIPNALTAGKSLIGLGKNAMAKITPTEIGKIYQSGHDLLKKSAEDIFETVGKQFVSRGIKNVPIKPNVIDQITPHMPKTDAAQKLLDDARAGDYSALRKLQTQLFKYGTKALKSDIPTENIKGEEIMDLRNKINKSISEHMESSGHTDLSKLLSSAMDKYRKLQETYYARKLGVPLKNMVHEESREIPKNIGELLSVDSVPINKIFKENPSVFDIAKKYGQNKNALKKLKYIAGGLTGLGVLGGLANVPGAIGKARNILGE